MELLSSYTAAYALDAKLESLHAQSRGWLNEIAFWKEEMSFFYKLIHLRQPHISLPTEGLASLEKEMINITSDDLAKLENEVEAHEWNLAGLVKNGSLSEEGAYREMHRSISYAMYNLQSRVREFKKAIFSFVQ